MANARARAEREGVPFDLTEDDFEIPLVCAVLHIPLITGEGSIWDYSPTIDRVIPEFGYVPTNIRVISHRANRIKSDGDADELAAVAAWLRVNADLARFGRLRKA